VTVHPIEAESYRRLRARVDLAHLGPLSRAVAERVIHASADIGYRDDLVLDEDALTAGVAALRAGAVVLTDVRMVAAGITGRTARCALDFGLQDRSEPTRSAAGMRTALRALPGAVVVVGCAPTALDAVVAAGPGPALVIGLPVGFVGAVEAKEALRACGLPAIFNRSEKGGSPVAAAAVNALIRAADA
jgi:precorrin-8X/cobalt-precorrin-8 methylmutase